MAAQIGSTRWILILSAMTAVTALSIDMSLPAQPTLATAFGVTSETAQLTLSLFLIGFAFSQIFVGYLSDAWGRRPVLLGGLALFTASGIACAASPTIEVLIACRVLQGVGGAAAPVIARAMVSDTQPAAQAARLLSTMLAALALAPMVAPSIGSAVLAAIGWRAIFATLALCGATLFTLAYVSVVETLPIERRTVASPRGLVRGFATFFRTPGTRLPVLIVCASFAGQFAYISDSPFILIDGYRVSPSNYALYFAATALSLMAGSITGGRMLRAGRAPAAMLVIGTSLLVTGGVLVAICTRGDCGIAGFVAPMLVYFFGIGITSPSATAMALAPTRQIAGTASAAIGFSTMVSGAVSGYATTRIGGSSPATFSIVVATMGGVAAVLAFSAAYVRYVRSRSNPAP